MTIEALTRENEELKKKLAFVEDQANTTSKTLAEKERLLERIQGGGTVVDEHLIGQNETVGSAYAELKENFDTRVEEAVAQVEKERDEWKKKAQDRLQLYKETDRRRAVVHEYASQLEKKLEDSIPADASQGDDVAEITELRAQVKRLTGERDAALAQFERAEKKWATAVANEAEAERQLKELEGADGDATHWQHRAAEAEAKVEKLKEERDGWKWKAQETAKDSDIVIANLKDRLETDYVIPVDEREEEYLRTIADLTFDLDAYKRAHKHLLEESNDLRSARDDAREERDAARKELAEAQKERDELLATPDPSETPEDEDEMTDAEALADLQDTDSRALKGMVEAYRNTVEGSMKAHNAFLQRQHEKTKEAPDESP